MLLPIILKTILCNKDTVTICTARPGGKLMVVGGQTATRDTDKVEIATVCRCEKHIPTA